MVATYNLCAKLINIGKSDIVNANIDIYLAAGRLTEEEYNKLLEMLPKDEL
jgi:hypothetical protein